MEDISIFVVVGLILLFAIFILMSNTTSEKYSHIGDANNIGSIDTAGAIDDGYELVESPENRVPGAHFADLINSGDQKTALPSVVAQRLSMDGSEGTALLPRISRGVTPYNVDVADPVTHSYMVNPPRVQLKDPIKMLADPYRGDIPIKYYPNVPLVNQSRYGRDSLRLDGFFSDAFRNLYNRYTGKGYKNMPMSVVNEETIMDA